SFLAMETDIKTLEAPLPEEPRTVAQRRTTLMAYPGTRPPSRNNQRMQRCGTSTGSQYISGHPPTMHWMLRALHSPTASSETLPVPKDRWNQTRLTSRQPHWRTTSSELRRCVATTTPSSGPGTEAKSG